jgi:hypothetical protein
MLLIHSDPDRIQSLNQNPNPKTGFLLSKAEKNFREIREKFKFLIKICSTSKKGLLGLEKPPERTDGSSKQEILIFSLLDEAWNGIQSGPQTLEHTLKSPLIPSSLSMVVKQSPTPSYLVRMGTTSFPAQEMIMFYLRWEYYENWMKNEEKIIVIIGRKLRFALPNFALNALLQNDISFMTSRI